MRYLPKSPAERQEMLAAIGVKHVEELFSSIPEKYRLKKPLNLPGPFSEQEVIRYFQERAYGRLLDEQIRKFGTFSETDWNERTVVETEQGLGFVARP